MISLENISKTYINRYGNTEVFRDFNFSIQEGNIISIYGGNGTGKSTLLKIIAKIIKPDSGKVSYETNNCIGFVWQNYSESLLPWLTVEQNITISDNEIVNERVKYLIDLFSFEVNLNSYPFQLSGGQQQQVCILRALYSQPNILLLDEPFSAIDSARKEKYLSTLLNFCKNKSITTFFISHNLDESILFADKVLVLQGNHKSEIVDINLSMREYERMTSPDFINYRNNILKLVRV